MIYSKGICWLDDTRIPFIEEEGVDFDTLLNQSEKNKEYFYEGGYGKEIVKKMYKPEGRFTPNLLVSDDALNDGKIGGGGKMKKTGYRVGGKSETSVGLNGKKDAPDNYGDKGSNSRYYNLDLWFNQLLNKLS